MTRTAPSAILVAALAACAALDEDAPDDPPRGATSGGDDNTFDHDNNQITVWELIDRQTREGPPGFTSRMHPCTRPRYATLGNILRSVGVDLTRTDPQSAAVMYSEARSALGAPDYASRRRENIAITTAGAARVFDIFAAGADEIIAAVPRLPRCQVGGTGPQLFSGNTCVAAGISCLIGVPAQTPHVELCTETIASATTPALGKRLAVAVMLAAAYTCE